MSLMQPCMLTCLQIWPRNGLLKESSSTLPIVYINTTKSNWFFDLLRKSELVAPQNHPNLVSTDAVSKNGDLCFPSGTRSSWNKGRNHSEDLSSPSGFRCMHITRGLEVVLRNISWKLPQKANLSHILPCSSSLRGCQHGWKNEVAVHCLAVLLCA